MWICSQTLTNRLCECFSPAFFQTTSRSNFNDSQAEPVISIGMDSKVLELVGLTEISCAARDAVVAVDDLGALIADKESFGVELRQSAVVVTQVLGQLQEVTNKVFKMRYEKEEALKRQLQEATASASTEQCGN